MCKPGGCVNVALSRIRRPTALQGWRSALAGGPAVLRNPSLLFVHGDLDLHPLLLPRHVERYWALQGGDRADEAALPNTGLLFAVDVLPANVSAVRDTAVRYPRPDLWKAERGRAGGARGHERERRGGTRRTGQHRRRWK